MSDQTTRTTTHTTRIHAPARVVYRVIADAVAWPQRFGPNVHVEREPLGAGRERLRIWATAENAVLAWTSLRELDEEGLIVRFRQEVPQPPIAAMAGTWRIAPAEDNYDACTLTLNHEFRAVHDDPEQLAWIERATERNSTIELSNIKALAESWAEQERLVFAFEDSVLIDGTVEAAYDFLYRADLWTERLPHVDRIEVREDTANVQRMTMVTRAKDGSAHTTESVRICFPHQRIVYKQLVPPALMTAHTGVWSIERTATGVVRVTSSHTVTVKPSAIAAVLGEGADLAAARAFIRAAVGGNSAATLALAKSHVEPVRV